MPIKQYKIRDINKNPELRKEVFVVWADAKELLNGFINAAVAAGADGDKLMESFSNEEN